MTCAPGKRVRTRHEGDRLIISTDPAIGRAVVSGRAPLVLASTVSVGRAALELTAGASMRQFKLGARTLIDVFAPLTPIRDHADVKPAFTLSDAGGNALIPDLPNAFAATIDNKEARPPKIGVPHVEPARVAPSPPASKAAVDSVPSAGSTNSIAAGSTCPASARRSILLPFSPGVGVAGFRRRSDLTLFFDEARPIDLAGLRADAAFGGATVRIHNDATELRLPINADQDVGLARQSGGWCLTIDRGASERAPMRIETSGSDLRFVLHSPGRVLTALDPSSGATLLIGTEPRRRQRQSHHQAFSAVHGRTLDSRCHRRAALRPGLASSNEGWLRPRRRRWR